MSGSGTRQEKQYPNITQTLFVHHLQLGLKAEDFELCDKLCPLTIYERIIEEVEQKEKAIKTKLDSVEGQMWKLFSELMEDDCLNSDKPD